MPMRKHVGSSVTVLRLVEAAAQLFASRGFNGVSTREIARLADVNEATLFRVFERKKELFWAAVEARLAGLKLSRELQSALAHDDDPSTVLPQICDFMVQLVVEQPELMRLLYFAALELPGSEHVYREHLGPVFDAISGYVARCTSRGALQNVDSSVTTLGLFGTVIAHTALYELFTGRQLPFANSQDAVSAYARFWEKALLNPAHVPGRVPPLAKPAVAGHEFS